MSGPDRKLKEWKPSLYHYWSSRFQSKKPYADLTAYCMFLGYPRSGHSLTGALLDAHPGIVMAHELNAIPFWKAGYRPEQIYHLIRRRSAAFQKIQAEWMGYSYKIDGLWQGSYDSIQIVGDKRGNTSLKLVMEDSAILSQIAVQVPALKIIHVVRNPFDMVATQTLRSARKRDALPTESLLKARFESLMKKAAAMDALIKEGTHGIYTLRHEDFIADPRGQLSALLDYLGTTYDEHYLSKATAIVFNSPSRSRNRLNIWSPELIRWIQERINRISFFAGYNFDH